MNQQYVKMDILFNSKREEKLKSHRFCIRQKKMGVGGREACFDRLKKSVAIHVQLFTLIIRPLENKNILHKISIPNFASEDWIKFSHKCGCKV